MSSNIVLIYNYTEAWIDRVMANVTAINDRLMALMAVSIGLVCLAPESAIPPGLATIVVCDRGFVVEG